MSEREIVAIGALVLVSVIVGAAVVLAAQRGDTDLLVGMGATGGAFLGALVGASILDRWRQRRNDP